VLRSPRVDHRRPPQSGARRHRAVLRSSRHARGGLAFTPDGRSFTDRTPIEPRAMRSRTTSASRSPSRAAVTAKAALSTDDEVGSAANALTSELSAEPSGLAGGVVLERRSPPPLRTRRSFKRSCGRHCAAGEDKMHDAAAELHPATQATTGGTVGSAGSPRSSGRSITGLEDLLRAELIAFPSRSRDGASCSGASWPPCLPLLVGVLAIVGRSCLLVVAAFTDVSIFALTSRPAWVWAWRSTTASHRVALPGGARRRGAQRRRSWHSADRREDGRVLAPSPLQSRSPRYSSSRSRSCGRSAYAGIG